MKLARGEVQDRCHSIRNSVAKTINNHVANELKQSHEQQKTKKTSFSLDSIERAVHEEQIVKELKTVELIFCTIPE